MNLPVSILLLDDEPMLSRATALMLSNRGGSVAMASTPDEAVALAATRRYDVAIVDLSSGPGASEIVRRMSALGLAPARVIAVQSRAADTCDAPEITAVLRKPYAFDRLLVEVFGDRERARPTPRARRAPRVRISARSMSRAARALRDRG